MGMTSVISNAKYIIIVALFGLVFMWAGYEKLRGDRLEVEVQMHKAAAENAVTIDEMNKRTADANRITLQTALDKQNELFKQLSELSTSNSRTILIELKGQQVTDMAQYKRISDKIASMQINSCQGLMEALIGFPQTTAVWTEKNDKQ